MRITFVKVTVSNPARPRKSAAHEFLVDSGAIHSVLPVAELKKLGVKPVREEEFLLANGEAVRKDVGNALFEYGGKIGAAPVIFGDEGVYLLGATTLEAVGLMLDPLRRELKPAPMLLMAALRTPIRQICTAVVVQDARGRYAGGHERGDAHPGRCCSRRRRRRGAVAAAGL